MELGIFTKGRETKPYIVRRQNLTIVGKGDSGKTESATRMCLDDIHQGERVIVIGKELPNTVLKYIPNSRQEETTYFNPTLQPMSFNPFWHIPNERHEALTDAFVDALLSKTSYGEGDTPRLEHMLRGCVLTLLRDKFQSPLSIYYLLTSSSFRKGITQFISDKPLKHFWDHFEALPKNNRLSRIESTENKLGPIVFSRFLRECLDQRNNHIDIKNGITLVSLDDLVLGEDRASTLGSMVLASILGQADGSMSTTVYIDDAERYGSRILARLLSHSSITTVLTVRSLDKFKNFNDIAKSSLMVATTTSILDAQILKSQFNFNNSHYPLNLIPRFTGYVMGEGEYADIFDLTQHEYEPGARSKRGRKSMDQRIIDRCGELCTDSSEKIEKRLGRFFK